MIAYPQRRILRPRLPNLAAFRRLGDPFGGRLGARMLPGVGGRSGGGAVPCAVVDTFTDANGTPLLAHTPDIDAVGGGWLAGLTSVFEIVSNRCVWDVGNGAPGHNMIDSGLSDCIVTCTLNTGVAVVAVGLVIRATNGSNNFEVWINPGPNTCTIHKNEAGVRTGILASNGITIDADTVYDLRITLDGTSIKVEVDEVEQFTYADAFNQAATQHGVMQWGLGASSWWDNFQICPL